MAKNYKLNDAKKNKKDEFYTYYETIAQEMSHYTEYFKDKIVYCNCDDYRYSEFVHYFKDNFKRLGLKKLIATNYSITDAFHYEYKNGVETVNRLKGNGDFRSKECIKILKTADIVVTNPPFSLKTPFIKSVLSADKQFIAILPQLSLTVKDISNYVVNDKIWIGATSRSGGMKFKIGSNYKCTAKNSGIDENGDRWVSFSSIKWFTNIPYQTMDVTYKTGLNYKDKSYSTYDNLNAIDVVSYKQIPDDYRGLLGVSPSSVHMLQNKDKYRLVGCRKGNDGKDLTINGVPVFYRYIYEKIS